MEQGGRILVGTDFSEGSALALNAARAFASRLGAKLDAMHVVESYGEQDWRSDDNVAAWLVRGGLELGAIVVRSGYPWIELVRYARETAPIMIVVGSHGMSGFQPLSLGSTAGRIGILSPYPVLVVAGTPARRDRSQAVS